MTAVHPCISSTISWFRPLLRASHQPHQAASRLTRFSYSVLFRQAMFSSSRCVTHPYQVVQHHLAESLPVHQVLELHGIQSVQIHGKMSASARASVIEKFRNSGVDGPRVAVISGALGTGHNFPFANILIFTVSLFSCPHLLTPSTYCGHDARNRTGPIRMMTRSSGVFGAIPSQKMCIYIALLLTIRQMSSSTICPLAKLRC